MYLGPVCALTVLPAVQAGTPPAAPSGILILDFTDNTGLYQTTDTSTPVTTAGQAVQRIDKAGIVATLAAGSATWQATGIVTAASVRFNVAAPFELQSAVIACTPSTGDTSDNHGLLGASTNYLTIGEGRYRWREAVDSTPHDVLSRAVMQIGAFRLDESTGIVRAWMDGVEAVPVPLKTPLTIERFFHRGTTSSFVGTIAYMALLTDAAMSDSQRRTHIKAAAEASWDLPTDRIMLMADDVPFNVHVQGTDDPEMPVLVSHHGVSGKTLDEGTEGTYGSDRYNAATFASTYGLQAFSPTFDEVRFGTSANYQEGGYPDGRRTADLEAPLVASIRAHLSDAARPVLEYGFSAGGQYLSRVAAYAPVPNVQRYVIGAPSTWVVPIRTPTGTYTTADSPYGFADLGLTNEQADTAIRNYLQLPITVYCGSEDNNPSDPDLGDSSNSLGQGAHRLERAQNVFAMAQAQAVALGVTCNWTLVIADGVGHAGTSMLNAPEAEQAFFVEGAATSQIAFTAVITRNNVEATIPATAPGDIAIFGAARVADATPITVPSGWIAPADTADVDPSHAAGGRAGVTVYQYPAVSGQNSGIFANANSVMVASYSGVRASSPILAMKFAAGTGTSINFPALTFSSDTAWVALWWRNGGTIAATPPGGGFVSRAAATTRGWSDSGAPLSSFAGATATLPASENWICCAIAFESA